MILVHTVDDLREKVAAARRAGEKIGMVPTMGALHEGHLSLVRRSQLQCAVTVVSIFVNPTQFGPTEDFARYPRTLESDVEMLAGMENACAKIIVFAPSVEQMYPAGFSTFVEPGTAARVLEGERRPGHFRGVATVVLKLFLMAELDIAFFGQKDFQQVAVVRQMVRELNVPTEIVSCPIIREPDGLAMSSRNRYLSSEARGKAPVLYESLQIAQRLIAAGQREATVIRDEIFRVLTSVEGLRVDYVALAHPETLAPVGEIVGEVAILLAVWLENTRLIDNCVVTL